MINFASRRHEQRRALLDAAAEAERSCGAVFLPEHGEPQPLPAARSGGTERASGVDFCALVRAQRDGLCAQPPRLRMDHSDGRWTDSPLVEALHRNEAAAEAAVARLVSAGGGGGGAAAAFHVPPTCRFLLSDAARLPALARLLLAGRTGGYRLVVLDPPWENVSARRAGAYKALTNAQVSRLPLPQLCAPGALVALWVTNRERTRRFVEETLLPGWGLTLLAEWLWLKTQPGGGGPVRPLHGPGRPPYEPLLLARFRGGRPAGAPPRRAVLAAASREHSRKPRLARLLAEWLPPPAAREGGGDGGSACSLELFARELEPGWDAWGNEPLLFQQRPLVAVVGDPPDDERGI